MLSFLRRMSGEVIAFGAPFLRGQREDRPIKLGPVSGTFSSQAIYPSSVTSSPHSDSAVDAGASQMARWLMKLSGAAPYQCHSREEVCRWCRRV